MSVNSRERFFTVMLNGLMSNSEFVQKRELAGEFVSELWALADMAVYHADNVETPHQKANRWIEKNHLIVDTETTGLDSEARIVEIAIMDCAGTVYLNTLVNPGINIPAEATAIHGITDEMVSGAPVWGDIQKTVIGLLSKRRWIAYNAEFDQRMIEKEINYPEDIYSPACAMKMYAEFNGEWDAFRRKYKRIKLVDAVRALNVWPAAGEGAAPHRALYDCVLTLNLIRAVAGVTRD